MLNIPVEIKELLHHDTCKKNIRIHFPNGERADICNDLIVKDSVSFTESLNSQDELKFGLCEAPIFECETVGVGNIKGATIEVSCEIYCDQSVIGAVWRMDLQAYVYPVPYGTFIVSESKRQADLVHRKILAYGGSATKSWGPSVFEVAKWKLFNGNGIYKPSIFYFANACGVKFQDDFFDFSSPAAYFPNGEMPTPWRQGQVGDYWVYVKYRGAMAYPNTSERLVEYKYDIINRDIYMPQIVDFLSQYYDSTMIQFFIETLIDYFYLGNGICVDTRTEDYVIIAQTSYGDGESIIYQPGGLSHYVGRTYLFTGYYIEIKDSQYGSILGTIDVPTVNNVSCMEKTIKSTFSYLADDKLSFKVVKGAQGGVVDYSQFDLQDYLSALIEKYGLFGKFDKSNEMYLLNIKQQFALLPDTILYPSQTLYPGSPTGGVLLPNDYQSCWYDDEYYKPFGAVQCQYKDSGNNDNIYIYYLTGYDEDVPIETYKIYDFSDNSIIQNNTWTSAQIQAVCEEIAANIDGVTYMPVEFVGRGLPYVEAGDTFEILTKSNESITTIVLNRTLTGEQTLTDSYKSV